MNLKTFWKGFTSDYTIILKSGAEIHIKAFDVVVTYNTTTLNITGYNIKGIEGTTPVYIVPSEIAAVIKL